MWHHHQTVKGLTKILKQYPMWLDHWKPWWWWWWWWCVVCRGVCTVAASGVGWGGVNVLPSSGAGRLLSPWKLSTCAIKDVRKEKECSCANAECRCHCQHIQSTVWKSRGAGLFQWNFGTHRPISLCPNSNMITLDTQHTAGPFLCAISIVPKLS